MKSIFELDDITKAEMEAVANVESNRRKYELCCLAHKLFVLNEEGKRFLELLKEDRILHREVALPDKDAAYAYFTEGENNAVRMLSYFAHYYPILVKKTQREKEELEDKNNGGEI